mgnify:CR=1 FL=1
MLRRLSGFAISLSLLALSTPVVAQDGPPPATAEEVAAAHQIAEMLIKGDDVRPYFTNITDDGTPMVRHTRSGLVCMFGGMDGSRVAIFPAQGGAEPGDDVGCLSRDETLGLDLTIYAVSAEEVIASAAYAIEQRFEGVKPFEGDLSLVSVEGMDSPLAAAYVYESAVGPMLTMALVAHRDGWSYKVRATGPAEDATVVSLMAGITLLIGMDVLDKDE